MEFANKFYFSSGCRFQVAEAIDFPDEIDDAHGLRSPRQQRTCVRHISGHFQVKHFQFNKIISKKFPNFVCLFLKKKERDNRTVLVGDASGRIYSWSVTDVTGRSVADHWLRDDTVEMCTKCRVKFSLTERRHHCRNFGHVFCSR
jgi:hypothetical protein